MKSFFKTYYLSLLVGAATGFVFFAMNAVDSIGFPSYIPPLSGITEKLSLSGHEVIFATLFFVVPFLIAHFVAIRTRKGESERKRSMLSSFLSFAVGVVAIFIFLWLFLSVAIGWALSGWRIG